MSVFAGERLLLLGLGLIFIGALGFYYLPGMISADAEGSHWVNAVYCSVMTLTTVGYGDICPSEDLTHLGRAFIVSLSFIGLGMFCGPVMEYASAWTKEIPGGAVGVAVTTLALGVGLFSMLEGISEVEAAYFTVVTGTTIGYGDVRPRTDAGKIAASLFAILVVNVAGGLLEPAKNFLCYYCSKREHEEIMPLIPRLASSRHPAGWQSSSFQVEGIGSLKGE